MPSSCSSFALAVPTRSSRSMATSATGRSLSARAWTICRSRSSSRPPACDSSGLPELLERLDTRLSLLTGGRRDAPERQQTLRATLDWSYGLLGADEQRALARVSIFAGGFTAQAAESVCDASLDEIALLVEQSLVRRQGGRLTLLETIREYGLERLAERGEEDELRRRHADWFVGLAERASAELCGANQVACLDRLEVELDNLRAALASCSSRLMSTVPSASRRRSGSSGRRATPKRAGSMLEASVELRAGDPAAARARAVRGRPAGVLRGRHATGARVFRRGAACIPRTRRRHLARLHAHTPQLGGLETGERTQQVELALEALAVLERVTEPWARAETLNYAGTALAARRRAKPRLGPARAGARDVPGDRQRAARGRGAQQPRLGRDAWTATSTPLAAYHSATREAARRVRDSFRLTLALGNLGLIEALTGDLEAARTIVRENLDHPSASAPSDATSPKALVVAAAVLARPVRPCGSRAADGRQRGDVRRRRRRLERLRTPASSTRTSSSSLRRGRRGAFARARAKRVGR